MKLTAVDGQTISFIGKGLMVLVGIERSELPLSVLELTSDDTPDDAAWIIKKVLGAKLWDGAEGGAWKQGVTDIEGEVLCGEFRYLLHPSTSLAALASPGTWLPWKSFQRRSKANLSVPVHSVCQLQGSQARLPREHGELQTGQG